MAGPQKQTTDAAEIDSLIGTDPQFVRALLNAFRELELGALMQVLLDATADWSGASCGFGLGMTGARRAFLPLAGTLQPEDPRAEAFGPIDPARLKTWLPEGAQVFEGLGPFEAVAGGWPESPPAACLALPVRSPEDRWVGVILLIHADPPAEEMVPKAVRLVEMAAPAVTNALQVLAMRELVIKDDTASCFNRRYFEEFLPEELSRASRFRSPVSLIFLDMDNLKEVNSRHGHAMGSRTLYEVSVRVRARIRKFDKLFRFGGDEFCIVLPETAWHGALEVAERVRDAISNKPFLTRQLGEEQGVSMTASLGIASFPLHARAREDLIQQADRAMQSIKRGTKNGIAIAEIAGGEDGR